MKKPTKRKKTKTSDDNQVSFQQAYVEQYRRDSESAIAHRQRMEALYADHVDMFGRAVLVLTRLADAAERITGICERKYGTPVVTDVNNQPLARDPKGE